MSDLAKQNPTEIENDFTPTKGMIKWFETTLELGHTASISEVARQAELQRSNWYQWVLIPGFVEWWDNQWQQYFKENRWRLKAIGLKQSERNYDYWHDMMVNSGQLNEKSPSVQVNTQVNLDKYIK
jgi:hypothetical protein